MPTSKTAKHNDPFVILWNKKGGVKGYPYAAHLYTYSEIEECYNNTSSEHFKTRQELNQFAADKGYVLQHCR